MDLVTDAYLVVVGCDIWLRKRQLNIMISRPYLRQNDDRRATQQE